MFAPGSRLDRFELLELLGAGGLADRDRSILEQLLDYGDSLLA